jgi:hypothetical protein
VPMVRFRFLSLIIAGISLSVFTACEDKKPEPRLGQQFRATPEDEGLKTDSDSTAGGGGGTGGGSVIDPNADKQPPSTTEKPTTDPAPSAGGGTTPPNPTADNSNTTNTPSDPAPTNTGGGTTEPPADPKKEDDTSTQCQAKVWGACRRTDGLPACDTKHNCTEDSIYDASVAKEAQSEDCKEIAKYEQCRTESNKDATKIAACDKTFQCTIADIKLKPETPPGTVNDSTSGSVEEVVSGSIEKVVSGSVDEVVEKEPSTTPTQPVATCNNRARNSCHKGGGGFSCDTKNNCTSPVSATGPDCYQEGFDLCKIANSPSFCGPVSHCSSTGAALPPVSQPAANDKPPATSSCDAKGRDKCLENAGGFACYKDFKCTGLVTSESNLCDSYGLKLCIAKGFGQKCYATYHCASSGSSSSASGSQNTANNSKPSSGSGTGTQNTSSTNSSGSTSGSSGGSSKPSSSGSSSSGASNAGSANAGTSSSAPSKPVPAKPVVRLDEACYKKEYERCRNGGGGNACADKSLSRYNHCRR